MRSIALCANCLYSHSTVCARVLISQPMVQVSRRASIRLRRESGSVEGCGNDDGVVDGRVSERLNDGLVVGDGVYGREAVLVDWVCGIGVVELPSPLSFFPRAAISLCSCSRARLWAAQGCGGEGRAVVVWSSRVVVRSSSRVVVGSRCWCLVGRGGGIGGGGGGGAFVVIWFIGYVRVGYVLKS